jgi:glycosyltransferase involved in cell wall biosynthesis
MRKILSIVTVTFNAEILIEKTIKSLLGQLNEEVEYIIVDGFSTDKTLEIIRKYEERIDKIISEKDLGIYDAMNKGINLSSGEYIFFLNAGDILNCDVINKILELLKKRKIDFLYGNVNQISKEKKVIYNGEFNKYKISKDNICHQSIFYRKRKLVEYGMFDLQYKLYADWVMNIKFFSRSEFVFYINYVISDYDMTGISSTSKDEKFMKDRSMIVRNELGWIVWLYYLFRVILVRKIHSCIK